MCPNKQSQDNQPTPAESDGNNSLGDKSTNVKWFEVLERSDSEGESEKSKLKLAAAIRMTTPMPNDVLLRSGEESKNNPGNIQFHRSSQSLLEKFLKGDSGPDSKRPVAEELANTVFESGGRFLDYDINGACWYVIDEDRAIRKCLNELRRKIREHVKQTQGYAASLVLDTHTAGKVGNITPDATEYIDMSIVKRTGVEQEKERDPPLVPLSIFSAKPPQWTSDANLYRTTEARPLPSVLALSKIFSSLDSKSQLFSSVDSVTKLMQSLPAVPIDLPPLQPEDDRKVPGQQYKGVEPLNTFSQTMGELFHSIRSISETAANACSSEKLLCQSDIGAAAHDEYIGGNSPVPKEVSDETIAGAAAPAQDFETLAAELAKSQELLIQKLLESVSRAAQSCVLAHDVPLGNLPDTDLPNIEQQDSSQGHKTSTTVGLFASREWGTNLGPVQEDVDFKGIFQTSDNKPPAEEKNRPTTRDWNALVVQNLQAGVFQTPDNKPPAEEKNKPKMRDWNALVMQNLQAGIFQASDNRPPAEEKNKSKMKAWNALVVQNLQAGMKTTDSSNTIISPLATETVELDTVPFNPAVLDSYVDPLDETEATFSANLAAAEAKGEEGPFHEDPSVERADKVREKVTPAADGRPKARSKPKSVTPTENDVLLGRGGRTNNNPGNKRYLEAKKNLQPRYLEAEKNGKTPISQSLVDLVHSWGGRFLKLDPQKGRWYEIDDETARKKCSQSLREINTPEERAAKRARYAK